MKILITILGILNGGYMLADGIFVLIKGKYIGPEKPGPWTQIFYKLNIDVFRLGWFFVLFGFLWLAWVFGLWTNKECAYALGLTLSILTLWYLPIGTLISLIILLTLLFGRQKIGL